MVIQNDIVHIIPVNNFKYHDEKWRYWHGILVATPRPAYSALPSGPNHSQFLYKLIWRKQCISFTVGIAWYIVFLVDNSSQLVTPILTVVAILDQYKLTNMRSSSDSSDVLPVISRGGVNGITDLVSCPGEEGPTRPSSVEGDKNYKISPIILLTWTFVIPP